MADFHPLRVAAREQLTDDAVAITFEVPPALESSYAFEPGQHLTIRRWFDDTEVRRTFSLCSPAGGALRIGVKATGLMSSWICSSLAVGDEVDVLTPLGSFGPREPLRGRRIGLIAAGSGITPTFGIASTALAQGADVVLLYGNRTTRDVMLLEDLEDLKDTHLDRIQVVHVLSREAQGSELLSGRMSGERLQRLVETFGQGVEAWYLCGPFEMVAEVRELLPDAHVELYHPSAGPARAPISQPAGGTEVVAVLAGRTSTAHVDTGETVLDAVLRVRSDAPYACRGGVCGTCRARLVEGKVEMDVNYALEPEEVAAGVVLTCQSRPTSERLVVEYL